MSGMPSTQIPTKWIDPGPPPRKVVPSRRFRVSRFLVPCVAIPLGTLMLFNAVTLQRAGQKLIQEGQVASAQIESVKKLPNGKTERVSYSWKGKDGKAFFDSAETGVGYYKPGDDATITILPTDPSVHQFGKPQRDEIAVNADIAGLGGICVWALGGLLILTILSIHRSQSKLLRDGLAVSAVIVRERGASSIFGKGITTELVDLQIEISPGQIVEMEVALSRFSTKRFGLSRSGTFYYLPEKFNEGLLADQITMAEIRA